MKKELENLKEMKEDLFISRIKLAESNKLDNKSTRACFKVIKEKQSKGS